jgi:hypothetical protein
MAIRKPPTYTLEQYEKYVNQEPWQRDSSEFQSQDDYDTYWSGVINKWHRQYQDQYKTTVTQWQDAISYIELVPAKSFDIFVPEIAIATDRIPIALASIMEQIAMLWSNYPQPVFVSPSEAQDQSANALNQFAQIELKANCFNSLMFDLGIDVSYSNIGVLKVYIDPDKKGPFNDDGKIVIQKIDPQCISVDPKARRLKWEDMGYLIYMDTFDLGQARKLFPGGASKLEDYFQEVKEPENDENMYGTNLKSPVPNPIEGNQTERNRVEIKECWFKDDRTKFVADTETVENKPFIDDPDKPGTKKANPDHDPDKPELYTRPKVDADGKVVGKYVPAYPYGRCIILAGGKRVVQDFANPYWHNQAPYVFFKGRPSRNIMTVGDLCSIIRLDKKFNDILSKIHVMAQQEIERPMIAFTNTFKTPRAWFKMSGQAQAVIVKTPGSEFGRLPPTEIPQFVFAYLQLLQQKLEKQMAIAGIMSGNIAEGSQLSAEAVSSVQNMATSVLKMKAELIAEGMKDLGYQLMWLIRETYPENLTVQLQQPDGTQIQVNWNEDNAADDYLVDIESSSGLPGQQDPGAAQVIPLYNAGLIDRPAALQMMRKTIPNWQQVASRMQKELLDKIERDAAGRAAGVNIRKLESNKNSPGGEQKI